MRRGRRPAEPLLRQLLERARGRAARDAEALRRRPRVELPRPTEQAEHALVTAAVPARIGDRDAERGREGAPTRRARDDRARRQRLAAAVDLHVEHRAMQLLDVLRAVRPAEELDAVRALGPREEQHREHPIGAAVAPALARHEHDALALEARAGRAQDAPRRFRRGRDRVRRDPFGVGDGREPVGQVVVFSSRPAHDVRIATRRDAEPLTHALHVRADQRRGPVERRQPGLGLERLGPGAHRELRVDPAHPRRGHVALQRPQDVGGADRLPREASRPREHHVREQRGQRELLGAPHPTGAPRQLERLGHVSRLEPLERAQRRALHHEVTAARVPRVLQDRRQRLGVPRAVNDEPVPRGQHAVVEVLGARAHEPRGLGIPPDERGAQRDAAGVVVRVERRGLGPPEQPADRPRRRGSREDLLREVTDVERDERAAMIVHQRRPSHTPREGWKAL